MSSYIRIKRSTTTIFQPVQPGDSFLLVKQKIGKIIDHDPQNIQLWHADQVREKSQRYLFT